MSRIIQFKRWYRRLFPDPNKKTNQELLKASDVFLASYPRSGNTWCRTILAHLLYPDFELQRLADIHQYIPAVHRPFPRYEGYSNPRVIKTHFPFYNRLGKKSPELYKKNIYVVRNVFDVIRSYYHYQNARGKLEKVDWKAFASRMAYGMYGPGLWQEHVLGWYGAGLYHGEVLMVKYEDLIKDTAKEIGRMAQFLGRTITTQECVAIAQKSNIHKMRKAQEVGAIGKIPNFVRSGEKRLPDLTYDQTTIDLILKHNSVAMDLLDYQFLDTPTNNEG